MVEELLGAHPIDDTFWDNTNFADVSVDTVNSEEQMAGSYITKFHALKDKQFVLADLLSQVDQNFDNQHDQQLMAPKYDTDHGHHNLSDLQSITSVDCKLVTHEDESTPFVTMQNEDHTDIMDELAATLRPPNHLKSSMPESTLQRISKMVTKEAVEDKKMDLMRSGTKIPENDVDVLDVLILHSYMD